MSTIWEARLREELREADPGPPTHRWWGPLLGVWEDAALAGREPVRRAALLIKLLAEEVGDTGLEAIAGRVAITGDANPVLVLELASELTKRSLAAKRMGRSRGER